MDFLNTQGTTSQSYVSARASDADLDDLLGSLEEGGLVTALARKGVWTIEAAECPWLWLLWR